MSFSSDVKEELARQNSKAKHCQIAELAAMIMQEGLAFETDYPTYLSLVVKNHSLWVKIMVILQTVG